MKNPKYRREYNALAAEFSLAAALIKARAPVRVSRKNS